MGFNKDIDRSMNQSEGKSLGKYQSRYGKVTGLYLRGILLCLAVGFILLGIQRDEAQDVLRKAVNICMECIGIG